MRKAILGAVTAAACLVMGSAAGAQTPGLTVTATWFPYQPWQSYSISQPVTVRGGPRTVVTYVTPGPSLEWLQQVRAPEPAYNGIFGPYDPTVELSLTSDRRSYEAGRRYHHGWYEQPLAPGTRPSRSPK